MDLFVRGEDLARGGFEPPTRGFSVHCSTPELPGRFPYLTLLPLTQSSLTLYFSVK